MRRRLLASYLAVTLATIVLLALPLGQLFASRERDRLLHDIGIDASVVAGYSEDALEQGEPPPIESVLEEYAKDPGGRIVVTDAEGIAVADSQTPGSAGTDFSNRPEIASAIAGRRTEGSRFSDTLDAEVLYVAVPVASGGTVHGSVRITYPSTTLDARVARVWWGIAVLSALSVAAVTAVGFALARLVTGPVERLKAGARAVAAGDLDARVPTDGGAPELRELAEVLNEMTARLQQIVTEQQAFVGDASHQLRTPLAALRLQLENIESTAPSDLQPALAAARAEAARLGRISEGLLSLSRAAGSTEPAVPVDVTAVVAERADTWGPVAAEAGVELVHVESPAVWARVQPGSVEQILDNLIDNALEYAPAGTAVELSVNLDPDTVAIHVVDHGPGMVEEQRRRALDRFWRSPTAPAGGTGLGLAIVAQLAGRAGGHASLEADVEGGIDAVVVLPRAEPPAPRRPLA